MRWPRSWLERPANTIRRFESSRSMLVLTRRPPSPLPRPAPRAATAFAVNPSITDCRARAMPSAPSGTSSVMIEPAPVMASSPTLTGATNTQSEPVLTRAPIAGRGACGSRRSWP